MSSDDEQEEKECPLCMEPFEIDDYNFMPCQCRYQICRFCWNRIRTEEDPALCPACRQQYPENPVNFEPLSHEAIQKIKSEKRQKAMQQRNKLSESRKHLSAYRVLQKNLVYVAGLPAKLTADPEILKKTEYFGKFGKILKVAVGTLPPPGPNTTHHHHHNQTPQTATSYITYSRTEDALRAIQAVNSSIVDGRPLKASLGTTKYCSSFLKGRKCVKQECLYLHEAADGELSFTKEDMMKGKHTEFERRLHEQMNRSHQSAAHQNNVGMPGLGSRRTSHSESDNGPPGFVRGSSQSNGAEKVVSFVEDVSHKEMANGSSRRQQRGALEAPVIQVATDQTVTNNHHMEHMPSSFGTPEVYPIIPSTHHQQQQHSQQPHPVPSADHQGANNGEGTQGFSGIRPTIPMMTCYELEQQFLSASAPPGFNHCQTQPSQAQQLQSLPQWHQQQYSQQNSFISVGYHNGIGSASHARSQMSSARVPNNDDDDDDIGFDPWLESSKGLADMLKEEQRASDARR